MKYDKERHLELLKKQEKSLNQDEEKELMKYKTHLQDHMFWQRRKNFLALIEDFNNDLYLFEEDQFETEFSELWYKTLNEYKSIIKNPKQIENCEISEKSFNFTTCVTTIFRNFEALNDEFMNFEAFKMDVRKSRNKIKLDYDV